jgi:hypothetical protein
VLRATFERRHRQLYGYATGENVECVNLRVTAQLVGDDVVLPPPAATGPASPAGELRAYFRDAGEVAMPRYERAALPAGQLVAGPAKFDEATGTTTFEVQLRNVSARQIYGPLLLKVKSLAGPATTPLPEVLDSDAGDRRAGAAWDFTRLLGTRRRLEPLMMSEARTITIRTRPESGLDAVFEFQVTGRVAGAATTKPPQ